MIYSMTSIKGPTLFLSLLSDRIMFKFWHVQRKHFERGSILSNFFVILNILASRRGWTFRGWKLRGFEEKTRFHHVRETEREYGVRLRNDAKIAIFDAAALFLELKWIEIYIFTSLPLFTCWQHWSKSNSFLAYHCNGYNKLCIINFSLHKVLT